MLVGQDRTFEYRGLIDLGITEGLRNSTKYWIVLDSEKCALMHQV